MSGLEHRNVYVNMASPTPSNEDSFAMGVLLAMRDMGPEERERIMSIIVLQLLADRSIEFGQIPSITTVSQWIAGIVAQIPAAKTHKLMEVQKAQNIRSAAAEGRLHPEHGVKQ